MDRAILLQGLAIVIGFPLGIIALGELMERCKRTQNPLFKVLGGIRHFLFPLSILWLILHQFFQVSPDATAMRVLNSGCWLGLIYILLLLVNIISLTVRARSINVPNLLFQFLRAFIVLFVLAYILGRVWQIDLSKIIGALGIGSVAIAISLQDTLSNLVSGLLLIVESPFKVGDWIKINDVEGEVIEINWRAVRIKTTARDIIIIPNGNLGKENICNYTLFDPLHEVRLRISFSYQDRPDLVSQTLTRVALNIKGIESHPTPLVVPKVFNNTSIEYQVSFFVIHYNQRGRIKREFWNQAYYAIRRAGLTIPFADTVQYKLNFEQNKTDSIPNNIAEILRSLQLFRSLDSAMVESLTQQAKVEIFATGEKIISAGERSRAFYIIIGGQAILTKVDSSGEQQEIAHLRERDYLGETRVLSEKPSPVSATATEIVTAIAIAPSAIFQAIQKSPQFALEISQFIDRRKNLIGVVEQRQNMSANSWN